VYVFKLEGAVVRGSEASELRKTPVRYDQAEQPLELTFSDCRMNSCSTAGGIALVTRDVTMFMEDGVADDAEPWRPPRAV